ncbi:uncharacterized protein LOC125315138 [Rhodamnia argentea]|uniref:Uncharacterized protein LOC125315138 n=1 Tax=Rhodamnia argentea TaxID=178133 RepID=A0ABM3HF97_9MYRT|nr:uncharacterized protein LOC125315138 [Rhodamnia argentea]
MAIPERLLRYRFHLLAALLLALASSALVYAAPRFVTVLAYFWPLLLSTALFLVAVVVFGKTSPPAAADASGKDLIDYVAGQPVPDAPLETPHNE